ncbi:MAG: 4-hydroxy-tetrahydrodipicolinate reductase [Clostridium sp.]|nr:4-hydroxy-tetrahydrodipicolinate reductase [Clostridium sp.]MCM1547428.1 4-hydroxy-tetrahydrodipicolinate reductase [Ruminococcus sp.]
MTKIVISGANGKMGKAVYNCITQRDDFKVTAGIDINTEKYADFEIYQTAKELPETPDAIIDYSNPSCLDGLLEYCLSTGTPVVLATTGYSEEQIAQIKKAAEQIPVFFSWNMSLGINLLVQLAKKATAILGDQFDIEIVEKHHNQKIDAPSGTALMIANAINDTRKNEMNYVYDRHSRRRKREPNEIGIHAVRGGTIVGVHEVIFCGNDETITISHSAASKAVFAEGSINAAEFIKSQAAGIYDMGNIVESK